MRTVLALDVSKGHSVLVAYDERETLLFEKNIKHTRSDINVLKDIIDDLEDNYKQSPEIVFEATGVYSRGLEGFLQDNKYAYSSVNPLEASFQTQSLRRHKTDKSDAHQLAKSHLKVKRGHTIHQSDYYRKMGVMSRRYDDIEEEMNLCKNRIHALLQLSFPEIETIFKSKTTLFFNIIKIFTHADTVLNSSKTIIHNRIKACTNKNYSIKKLEERAIQLIEVAQNSYPAIDEDDYECRLIKAHAQKVLDLDKEQEQIIDEMEAISTSRKEYHVLLSFPGIQKTTACRLIGEIGGH